MNNSTTPQKRLFNNILSSWSTSLLTAIVAFFMSPFLVHNLGTEQYGIWALVLSIISYSSLLNAGMNQTLNRYVPKYYSTNDTNNLNQVVNSVLLILSVSGALVLTLSLIIAFFFLDSFNIAPEHLEIARNVLILIGINTALIFFYTAPSTCGPFHRHTIGNGIEVAKVIIGSLITVYFLKIGHGLLALAIITVAMTLSSSHIRTIIRNKYIYKASYSIKFITKTRLLEMLNYGGISFLIVATYLIIFNTDNIVIGLFISTTAVTYYSISASLIAYVRVIANAVGIPLTPLIAHMDSTSDLEDINNLYRKISKKLYYIYSCLGVAIIVWGKLFMFLWMGPEFIISVNVLYILIIPACIYLPQVPANSILLGLEKHKLLFYILLIEALSNIVLSLILVQKWGVYGVAWGTAIPQLIIYSIVYPYYFNKSISGKLKIFYQQSLKMICYGIVFTLPISLLLIKFNYHFSWIGFLINIFITSIFIALGLYFVALDSDEKNKVVLKIKSLLRMT